MLQDTRMTLCLVDQHIKALRVNEPDTFKRWLYGGIQDLGEAAVTELLLDWIDPFITPVELDPWNDVGDEVSADPPHRPVVHISYLE